MGIARRQWCRSNPGEVVEQLLALHSNRKASSPTQGWRMQLWLLLYLPWWFFLFCLLYQVSLGWWHTWCTAKSSKPQLIWDQRTGGRTHGTTAGLSSMWALQPPSLPWAVGLQTCYTLSKPSSLLDPLCFQRHGSPSVQSPDPPALTNSCQVT